MDNKYPTGGETAFLLAYALIVVGVPMWFVASYILGPHP